MHKTNRIIAGMFDHILDDRLGNGAIIVLFAVKINNARLKNALGINELGQIEFHQCDEYHWCKNNLVIRSDTVFLRWLVVLSNADIVNILSHITLKEVRKLQTERVSS
jgi:hypothetical protein